MIKIKRAAMEFILTASKNTYPREFIGLLRKNKNNEISEVIVLPKSTYGKGFSSVDLTMVPYTSKYCGSIHSHPLPNSRPSKNDLLFFSKIGGVHILASYPFSEEDIKVYNKNGEELKFEIA
jgi:proteasome lid subunit RPN8/RPN11